MVRQAEDASSETELLIHRCQRGDREAFDRLMALHVDKVFALAWGVLRNREDAIDATQEVFIKLHGSVPRFRPTDNLSAWLYRVCLNHCIDRKRRVRSGQVEMTDEDWDRLQGSEQDRPEVRAQQSETGRIIRAAIDDLPERQRLVFILRHYKLLSINEIGEAIGCSSGAVKAHLSRATGKLRDTLKGKVFLEAEEVSRDEV
jgi:RNA polymerase sigma-70 factor, ECF subfamily